MRRILAAAVALILVVGIGTALWWSQNQSTAPTDNLIQIELSSQPFPLIVGQNTLLVKLLRGGAPVDGGRVSVEATRAMQGQLPLTAAAAESSGGVYRIPIIWSAADRWTIDITAEAGGETVTDQFVAFVFSVPEENAGSLQTYASMKAVEAAQAANPDEYWIVIPQGTAAQIREGHGDDIMPTHIRLSVDGKNTLVLRNNDLAHHTIGPFFVRSGETVRQTFSTPQIYEGVCSVRHDSVVRIIIE
jgi:hypothetical protein